MDFKKQKKYSKPFALRLKNGLVSACSCACICGAEAQVDPQLSSVALNLIF